MRATQFDDDDEIERQIARLLDSDWAEKPKALNDDEQRIAAKLLGSAAEASRLAATKPGQRFKYRPAEIRKIEVYFSFGLSTSGFLSGWRLEVFPTGGAKRHLWRQALDDGRCAVLVSALKDKGYRVDLVVTEGMRARGMTSLPAKPVVNTGASSVSSPGRPIAQSKPSRSKRFAMMEELRGFKR